jgi:S1-C subfamily serine protease
MITCPTCAQPLGEEVSICPHCSTALTSHRTSINGYHLGTLLREGYASLLYRGSKAGTEEKVLVRVFKPEAPIDAEKADKIKKLLDRLSKPPSSRLVRHHELACTEDGTWYRVSEWVDMVAWSDLIASRFFQQPRQERKILNLFIEIASAVADLHQHGLIIPFLTYDDILIYRDASGELGAKIDYKFSLSLDPDLAQPPLMLQKLLAQHPDFCEKRPLDMRSDIWSLGKIFIELLAGSDDLADLSAAIEPVPWHRKIKVLLRQMIEDDPALRLNLMSRVIELLSEVSDADIEKARTHFKENNKAPLRQARRMTRIVSATFLVLIAVLGSALFLQWRYSYFFHDEAAVLTSHAKQATSSVAFVAVHYWIEADGKKKYVNLTEGTAFLVDAEGYLLTNRHVVCPWLEDATLDETVDELLAAGQTPTFGYVLALWFEGDKALKRARGTFGPQTKLQDVFFTDGAYRSDGSPKVTIAGIFNPPREKREEIEFPLGNDVAVLKIDRLPAGMVPLSIDANQLATLAETKLPALAVIGFPLGSRTNMDSILHASVTFGHVRRIFPNVIQADVSMHSGISGGPVLNAHGQVLGIASAVANQRMLSSIVPQSDFGLILPIEKGVGLLREIKANQPKWNGVIDPQQPIKTAEVFKLAEQGDWKAAAVAVDDLVHASHDPAVLKFAGLVHLAAGSPDMARMLLGNSIAIEPGDGQSKFIAYLCDRELGHADQNPWRQELLELNWRSSYEFYGYLVKIMENHINDREAIKTVENQDENALLCYVTALGKSESMTAEIRKELLGKALNEIGDSSFFSILIRSALNKYNDISTESKLTDSKSSENHKKYNQLIGELAEIINQDGESNDQQEKIAKYMALWQKIKVSGLEMKGLNPTFSFHLAADGEWTHSLAIADDYLTLPGRESANRLGMELFRGQLLLASGLPEKSNQALRSFADHVTDPWYRSIALVLLGQMDAETLQKQALLSPELLLTLNVALGLQAESKGQSEAAINNYSLALESFLNTWLEYDFAISRIRWLRK